MVIYTVAQSWQKKLIVEKDGSCESKYTAVSSFVGATAALRRCVQLLQDSIPFRTPATADRKSAMQIEVLIIFHNLDTYAQRLRLKRIL